MSLSERSAGAVLFQGSGNKRLYLLLFRSRDKGYPDDWTFPKGHIEKGETALEAAEREVIEETGIQDISFIDGFEKIIMYQFKRSDMTVQKKVIFFLAKAGPGKVTVSDEHDDFMWADKDAALKKLTYSSSRELLLEAERFLEGID